MNATLTDKQVTELDELDHTARAAMLLKIINRLNFRVKVSNMFRLFTGKRKRMSYSLLYMIEDYTARSDRMQYEQKLHEAIECETWTPSVKDLPNNI